METNELKNIWQAYNQQLDKLWTINLRSLEILQSQRSKSALRTLLIFRIIELLWLLSFNYFLDQFLFSHLTQAPMVVSAGILMLFFIIATAGCISQIALISHINYSQSVTDIQQQLARLQTYVIRYLRLSLLQLPFYTAYLLVGFEASANIDLTASASPAWWISQLIVSLLFIPLSLWLYRNISPTNLHKPWVRTLVENAGGRTVARALDFMKEIDEFKKEQPQ